MTLAERCRPDFAILNRRVNGKPLVYLDSAASSQKPRQVIEAVRRYYETTHANVHRSIHTLGEEATALLESVRDRVRQFIGAAQREEIVFTRGTTDAINLVAQAIGRTVKAGDEVIVTEMEHHSNLIPWQMLCRDRGAVLKAVPVIGEGFLDLEAFTRLLSRRTRVVAVAHVSNVLGTINPVREIAERAHAAGALVLVDGAQAVPNLPVNVQSLGADFYAFSGHKMLGPTGGGVLYGRRAVLDSLEPAWGGGEMIKEVWIDHAQWNDLPWRFEPGTPPIAPIVGLGAAVEYLSAIGMEAVAAHERALCRLTLELLAKNGDTTIYGPRNPEIKGAVVAFNVRGLHPHDVAHLLDQEGIAVRAGHHCAMPLMRRLGVVGTVRASFSVHTTPAEIEHLARSLSNLDLMI
ncbi:MAG: cysteine desulfurase [Candidatus Rokubacteria bacterium]|nr:cysteine desulfurase [Candidatus Rokubacteria bacterium]MBI2554042.1 cysteine desulfurase [Candidatus Rokubacteria bacterium]